MNPPTQVKQHIRAPRSVVCAALLDETAVAQWKVPDGMTAVVHEWDPHVGGRLRVSLSYRDSSAAGKTTGHTDTYHGRFVELVPNERVVEVDEFETTDPRLRGQMRATFTLVEADGGTDLVAVHEGLPDGVAPEDNELGWKMSLRKLAAYCEARSVR